MKINQIYRYSSESEKQDPALLEVDGFPNFYYHTYFQGATKIQFQKGIHPIGKVKLDNGTSRTPAIILSSSPHRYGSEITPWEDIYDPDFGHVRYYGDNRSNDNSPERKAGNSLLLKAFNAHSSPIKQDRIDNAVPILFFERTPCNGAQKGYLRFHGYGVIESVELITQYDVNTKDGFFSNYVFDLCVFSLKEDNEDFSWDWINARRDKNLTNEQTLKCAPKAWQKYIEDGISALGTIRRHVYTSQVYDTKDQKPIPGSKDEQLLQRIYSHYESRRDRFELFAMTIAQEVFEMSGAKFQQGWVTKKTGDGGIDFIARSDISTGMTCLKMIVLGQAKCEAPNVPTNGTHIARTVARLKRGWIGVYVTTSYFSSQVQKEILEDQYPIMLINGLEIVKVIKKITFRDDITAEDFFKRIDCQYNSMCKNRRPEEILLD